MKPEYFWGGAIGSLAWADIYLHRHRPAWTLSHLIRTRGRADTRAGRVLLISGWCVLTAWFIPHIVMPALEQMADDWTSEGP